MTTANMTIDPRTATVDDAVAAYVKLLDEPFTPSRITDFLSLFAERDQAFKRELVKHLQVVIKLDLHRRHEQSRHEIEQADAAVKSPV